MNLTICNSHLTSQLLVIMIVYSAQHHKVTSLMVERDPVYHECILKC